MQTAKISTGGRFIHRLNRLKAVYRLLIGVLISVGCSELLSGVHMEFLTRIMVGWDIYSTCILSISAISFFTMKADHIRVFARKEDASRGIVFLIVLIACVTSLVAVLDLLTNKGGWQLSHRLEAFIYLYGVLSSWLLMHTMFTLRYAHIFYGDHPSDPDERCGGLDIPGDPHPDYLDFAYFSFVIGMTFQVSDINITSSRIRRIALLQGLISFLFNTVIVALTINEVVNLN